jgi:large subunit ribosomal protein L21e
MVKASKGSRSRTRHKFRKRKRERGLSPITKKFQNFYIGDKASVIIDPSIHKGQPHARFQGRTGTVIGVQGKSYVLSVRDGGKTKRLIVAPEHLKKS